MKKRIMAWLLTLCMIVTLVPLMAVSAFAASAPSVQLYVAKNEAAGLGGNVSISVKSTSKGYEGTLYLPGSADTSACFLSWNEADVTLSADGVTYESGSAPVAPAGNSVTYTVSNGSSSAKYTVKTVQGSAQVEGLFLNIDESMGSIAAMNGDPDHNTSCFGSLSFDGSDYYMSIKGRGNSTWSADKKPYNITFYKKADFDKKLSVSLIDGTNAKKWSLLANDVDPSLLRNKIGLDYANALGIGLPSRFADVWLNGEYLGNYLITPKNDYQATDTGFVLEIDNYSNKEDPQFRPEGLLEIGLSDGYYNRITVKDIGEDADIDAKGIEKWVNEAWKAILDYDSDAYLDYIDMDSWAKMYLLYEITKTYDSYSGSLLMHRDGTSPEDKLIAGPAWDLDNSFGRMKPKTLQFIGFLPQVTGGDWFVDSIGLEMSNLPLSWLQELGKHKDFMERVYEIYNETTSASYDLCMNIDVQAGILAESAEMNHSVWNYYGLFSTNYTVSVPITLGVGAYAVHYKTTNCWMDFVDNLKEYVGTRMKFLYDKLLVEKPEGSITGPTAIIDGGTLKLTADTAVSGNLTYTWQCSADGNEWQDIAGANGKSFSTKVTAEADGMYYRCIVKNSRGVINTNHVADASPSVSAVFEPVCVSVTAVPALVSKITPVSVNADVTVKKVEASSLIKRLLGISSYKAEISVSASGTDIESVAYSLDGRSWSTGTELTRSSNIKTLYVRVTDDFGNTYDFLYSNGTTNKL